MRIFQLQRISAVALLIFLTVHMVVIHYPPFHIDFSRIIVRMSQPIWKAVDIGFLFFVLVHALTGIYVVITDLDQLTRYRPAISGVVMLVGLLAFIYGVQTIMAFQPATTSLLP